MGILKTIKIDKVEFLLETDYVRALELIKGMLGSKASFLADVRLENDNVIWSVQDDVEYLPFNKANDEEKRNIKAKLDEQIAIIWSIFVEDPVLASYDVRKILSYPSSNYMFYTVVNGDYKVVLTGWGCDEYGFIEDDGAYLEDNKGNLGIVDCGIEKENSDDEDEDFTFTSEWLKENTEIRGWLGFFFFAIAIGGLISAVYPIATFNIADYAGNLWLGAIDVISGIILFAVAIYAIYAFCQRKPNAVFYGKLYVIIVFVTNVISAIGGTTEELGGIQNPIRGIVWGIIWFVYLLFSNQVKEVIPISFRKIRKIDWAILSGIVSVPVLCFVIGLLSVNAEVEKRQSQEEELMEKVLQENEQTDGRIIFTIPSGAECKSEEVEVQPGSVLTIFTITSELGESCVLCSDYDDDISAINFDKYWTNWESEEDKLLLKTDVDRGNRTINGYTCVYRIVKYDVNGVDVYWRFHIMFDKLSGKCCVVSFYDRNEPSECLNEILNSIRFN